MQASTKFVRLFSIFIEMEKSDSVNCVCLWYFSMIFVVVCSFFFSFELRRRRYALKHQILGANEMSVWQKMAETIMRSHDDNDPFDFEPANDKLLHRLTIFRIVFLHCATIIIVFAMDMHVVPYWSHRIEWGRMYDFACVLVLRVVVPFVDVTAWFSPIS